MARSNVEIKDKLAHALSAVISDTEEVLKATVDHVGEKSQEIRAKAAESLRAAKASVEELENLVVENSKFAVASTNQYVHKNPWQAIGMAAGAGLVLGWILSRK
jgi:ElaB/YqjD/DUF883 family membrane-anchored ribosome-binding protein